MRDTFTGVLEAVATNETVAEIVETVAEEATKEKSGIAEFINEELEVRKVFSFDLFGKTIPVTESVVVSWIVIAVILLVAFLLTRNLKVHNISKRQAFVEFIVTKLHGLVEGMIGEEGRKYVPYLVTVLLYIGFSNIIGVFGFKSPTKDLNVTAALAIMSIILIEGSSIKARGFGKHLKSKCEPIAIVAPINFLEILIRPLSLCMRLFGNVLGAFVIMKLIEYICHPVLPVVFSLYFDLFDGLIQAYVFVFLTSLFIKEGIEVE